MVPLVPWCPWCLGALVPRCCCEHDVFLTKSLFSFICEHQKQKQVRNAVFAGLLVGVVDTLPKAALKYDLACECDTEEWFCHPLPSPSISSTAVAPPWHTLAYPCLPLLTYAFPSPISTGTSAVCGMNRLTIYLLLGILVNLCGLTYKLCSSLTSTAAKSKRAIKILDYACVGIPLSLMVLGYSFDTSDTSVTNGVLNVSRQAFSCRYV